MAHEKHSFRVPKAIQPLRKSEVLEKISIREKLLAEEKEENDQSWLRGDNWGRFNEERLRERITYLKGCLERKEYSERDGGTLSIWEEVNQ